MKNGDVVLNVGANIGAHTILMSKLVGDSGKIFSFEANPKTYSFLQANICINNASNIISYNKAAFSEEKQLDFISLEGEGLNLGASFVSPQDNSWRESTIHFKPQLGKASKITVDAIRIDDLLRNVTKIDLIQIDIEGSEPPAIYGAKDLIPSLIINYSNTRNYKSALSHPFLSFL